MMLVFRSAECKKHGVIGASTEISKKSLGVKQDIVRVKSLQPAIERSLELRSQHRCLDAGTDAIGYIVCHVCSWSCFGLISPYIFLFLPFGMKTLTLEPLYLKYVNFFWVFWSLTAKSLCWVSEETLDFLVTLGLLRLWELLKMD
jgi:hypothetical protein